MKIQKGIEKKRVVVTNNLTTYSGSDERFGCWGEAAGMVMCVEEGVCSSVCTCNHIFHSSLGPASSLACGQMPSLDILWWWAFSELLQTKSSEWGRSTHGYIFSSSCHSVECKPQGSGGGRRGYRREKVEWGSGSIYQFYILKYCLKFLLMEWVHCLKHLRATAFNSTFGLGWPPGHPHIWFVGFQSMYLA